MHTHVQAQKYTPKTAPSTLLLSTPLPSRARSIVHPIAPSRVIPKRKVHVAVGACGVEPVEQRLPLCAHRRRDARAVKHSKARAHAVDNSPAVAGRRRGHRGLDSVVRVPAGGIRICRLGLPYGKCKCASRAYASCSSSSSRPSKNSSSSSAARWGPAHIAHCVGPCEVMDHVREVCVCVGGGGTFSTTLEEYLWHASTAKLPRSRHASAPPMASSAAAAAVSRAGPPGPPAASPTSASGSPGNDPTFNARFFFESRCCTASANAYRQARRIHSDMHMPASPNAYRQSRRTNSDMHMTASENA